ANVQEAVWLAGEANDGAAFAAQHHTAMRDRHGTCDFIDARGQEYRGGNVLRRVVDRGLNGGGIIAVYRLEGHRRGGGGGKAAPPLFNPPGGGPDGGGRGLWLLNGVLGWGRE